jgi:hypothetical protein
MYPKAKSDSLTKDSFHRLMTSLGHPLRIIRAPSPHHRQLRGLMGKLLQYTCSCHCADPRDHVFAIMNILNWPDGPPIQPDYNESAKDLFCDVLLKYEEDLLENLLELANFLAGAFRLTQREKETMQPRLAVPTMKHLVDFLKSSEANSSWRRAFYSGQCSWPWHY